jgi:catechol 2,3-dioxygenase-like lactoylglutathione lyase family enzyme
MNIGWCDVCLRVKSARESREFYEKLGFRRVEGDDEQGWAVVTNGEQRLGLYEAPHMGDNAMSLNFRGADVPLVCSLLAEKGMAFEKDPAQGKGGGWSASLRDPDGFLIFFDTAPGETKRE